MSHFRALKWLAIALALVAGSAAILASISNWNWLRGPLSRQVADATGRTLTIRGDLEVDAGWPNIRIRAADVTFSNPAWARADDMFTVRQVSLDMRVAPLFRRAIVFDRVRVDRATVFLEKSSDGRKNWLLDRKQTDDKAQVAINHLAVNDGRVTYRDSGEHTHLEARLTTRSRSGGTAGYPLAFSVTGRYRGEPLTAEGAGDTILALRNSTRPYRLDVAGRVASTRLDAEGTITNLLNVSATDLHIKLRGDSLARLYPLLGVVFPDTPPYRTEGRLRHAAGWWRYERFSGTIGQSDIAGLLQVDTSGRRPFLRGTVSSRYLDLGDLGPVVGASSAARAPNRSPRPGRVLPATPFRAARWDRMDADVRLNARSVRRAASFPINDLSTRLRMRDAVVTLDPLKFGLAGGTLSGTIRLDGRQQPIRAAADLRAKQISLLRLFPATDLEKAQIGQINGKLTLHGRGDTVAAMLADADGHLAMVVNGGEISKLAMETASLHLLEMLQLTLTGDEPIRIRCGVAAFDVKQGVMQTNALVLDTDIARVDGTGRIDLGDEQLDLTLVPQTKKMSLLSLRTPIRVEGSFARPQVTLDKGKLALRGLGALALGAVNPALALIPLVDAGSGEDSNCRHLIARTRTGPAASPSP